MWKSLGLQRYNLETEGQLKRQLRGQLNCIVKFLFWNLTCEIVCDNLSLRCGKQQILMYRVRLNPAPCQFNHFVRTPLLFVTFRFDRLHEGSLPEVNRKNVS